jgi:tetratricopeptide (TPR) repeat protein
MNKFLIDNHITSLFKTNELFDYMQIFLQIKSPLFEDSTFKEEFLTFFEKNLKDEEIKGFFDKLMLPIEEYNFNFSIIALLMNVFALKLETSKDLPKEEKIKFFYEEILNLKNFEEVNLTEEKIEEEKPEEKVEDYVPESETLNKCKESFGNYSKDDIEFVNEFLLMLDKILPPEDENILMFSNEYDYPTKKVYTNDMKSKIPKFPVERLAVEVEEERERKIEEQEKRQIAKAKKAKKNQKEKVENPYDTVMGEVPNININNERYLGHEKILTLTHRLIKHTFKELLPNSKVYPSLLKEVLIIPPLCPQKCIESIVESMEEQVNGRYELAIRRLEKAQEYLPKDNSLIDWQTDLFFNLSFGSLYDTLGYDVQALKYYYESTRITEKLIGADTDTSLPYCFLGELFVKLQEYNWALRSFLKAKKIREETIGGETPDTAATYNNLGVVAYCMESYLPAKGFFKLAYEIYKSLLGLTHPRTMLIKSNLSKMNQLNFNKEVEFKTLSKYATPAQLVKNPKKKK